MTPTTVAPARSEERSKNPLRPTRLDEVVGQEPAKQLVRAAIETAVDRQAPVDHMLFVGSAGTGKSTFSHVMGNELGVDVWDLEAPVSFDTLLELRTQMQNCDILKIEEIHQQGIMERRGRSAATQPEVFYSIMEDRVLPTERGILEFPAITVIGTTTDEGLLPDSFIDRFPLRPRLVPYTEDDLKEIVHANASALDLRITYGAIDVFADACRGVPRQINNFVKNAVTLTTHGGLCDVVGANNVLAVNGITRDGLTPDMQQMLVFLLTRARQKSKDGEVKYQASVNTIATAIGKSRDSKAIALRVEPYLIELGYVQVTHGGRRLTDDGILRAKALTP
jgi:Holliday junction DNA helicase RuvB